MAKIIKCYKTTKGMPIPDWMIYTKKLGDGVEHIPPSKTFGSAVKVGVLDNGSLVTIPTNKYQPTCLLGYFRNYYIDFGGNNDLYIHYICPNVAYKTTAQSPDELQVGVGKNREMNGTAYARKHYGFKNNTKFDLLPTEDPRPNLLPTMLPSYFDKSLED